MTMDEGSGRDACWILGVHGDGLAGLAPRAVALLAAADLVIGARDDLERLAAACKPGAVLRDFSGGMGEMAIWIEEAQALGRQVVVLATGNPLFHGLGNRLHSLLPGRCRVLGQPSTLQRAMEWHGGDWRGVCELSVHARESGEWDLAAGSDHALNPFYQALAGSDRVGVLTSPANDPARLARLVMAAGWEEGVRMTVVERWGSPDQRLAADLTPARVAAERWCHPNVVLCRRDRQRVAGDPVLGLDDAGWVGEGDRLVTRREIRVVALSQMALLPGSLSWDIGAGSGSVGLEAARLSPLGRVHAVERHPGRAGRIRRHQARLGVCNYHLTEGEAPAALAGWPDPDRVFIGGSGVELAAIVQIALRRLTHCGRLVMNFVALGHVVQAGNLLEALGVPWEVMTVQVNRSRPIADQHRLVAENPVWILTAVPGSGG